MLDKLIYWVNKFKFWFKNQFINYDENSDPENPDDSQNKSANRSHTNNINIAGKSNIKNNNSTSKINSQSNLSSKSRERRSIYKSTVNPSSIQTKVKTNDFQDPVQTNTNINTTPDDVEKKKGFFKDRPSKTDRDTLSADSNPFAKKHKELTPADLPSKEALLKQIKSNIFFLEQLLELLEQNTRYLSYQKKVVSMQKNSHNSHKIISRLRNDAVYYDSTMEMIFRHTNTITQILEIST